MNCFRLTCLVVALLAALPARARLELRVGMPVEIALVADADGMAVADDLTPLAAPRSPKLRGAIRAVDTANQRITVLDWTFALDQDCELQGVETIEQLSVGQIVELNLTPDRQGGWAVDEIDANLSKSSWKIKGTLTRIEGKADAPRAVEVDGLRIAFDDGIDLHALEDSIAEDLFRVIREEDKFEGGRSRARRVGPLAFSGSLRQDWRRERDLDLQTGDERDQSEPSLRVEMLSSELKGMRVFSQLRWLGRYDLGEGGASRVPAQYELEVRQLYVSHRELFGLPLGIVAGKQRIQDEREFLFDDYLDGVRLYYYGVRPLVLELTHLRPVVPLSEKLEHWHDWLAQTRWYIGTGWKARLYGLWRDDRSSRGRDVHYQGIALHGRQGPLKLWFDAAHLGGIDKGQKQAAWAIATGLGLRASDWPLRPSFWAGFARGSGDEDPDDGVSGEFRQPGYEDNSSRVWGIASFRHFGELLDPELANLRVLSAGVAIRPKRDLSIELIAHRYALDVIGDEFNLTDLRLSEDPLDGVHRGLGHGIDLVVAWRNVFDGLHLVGRTSVFVPGEAFAPDARTARLHRFELRWDF